MNKTFLVDTNVVVRYFIDGDKTLEELIDSGVTILLTTPVIFEIVFTLKKNYEVERDRIYFFLSTLLEHGGVEVDDRKTIFEILNYYKIYPSLALVDCYLKVVSERDELEVFTYDKKLKNNLSK